MTRATDLRSGTASGPDAERGRPRSRAALAAIGALAALLTLLFAALGIWQVERRAWKLDLIARVEARVRAEPVAPPGPSDWPTVSAARDEYRRVTIEGRLLPERSAFVQAVTARGPGFWLLTPLRTEAGFDILVNRGFVPDRGPARAAPPDGPGPARVTGLLRLSEPGGGFLRANDPGANRWFSRDVAAIAGARGLGPTAPYFIDQDGSADREGGPVGGLTVIAFRNEHLVYAVTWFCLAAMTAGAGVWVIRQEGPRRRRASVAGGDAR